MYMRSHTGTPTYKPELGTSYSYSCLSVVRTVRNDRIRTDQANPQTVGVKQGFLFVFHQYDEWKELREREPVTELVCVCVGRTLLR
jgi:hypothetical protein